MIGAKCIYVPCYFSEKREYHVPENLYDYEEGSITWSDSKFLNLQIFSNGNVLNNARKIVNRNFVATGT